MPPRLGFPDETVFPPEGDFVEILACRPLPGWVALVWDSFEGSVGVEVMRAELGSLKSHAHSPTDDDHYFRIDETNPLMVRSVILEEICKREEASK